MSNFFNELKNRNVYKAATAYVVSGWNTEGLPPWTLGYVSLPAFALIIVTSIITAPVGAALAHRLPERTLRILFALFLFVLSMKMLLG